MTSVLQAFQFSSSSDSQSVSLDRIITHLDIIETTLVHQWHEHKLGSPYLDRKSPGIKTLELEEMTRLVAQANVVLELSGDLLLVWEWKPQPCLVIAQRSSLFPVEALEARKWIAQANSTFQAVLKVEPLLDAVPCLFFSTLPSTLSLITRHYVEYYVRFWIRAKLRRPTPTSIPFLKTLVDRKAELSSPSGAGHAVPDGGCSGFCTLVGMCLKGKAGVKENIQFICVTPGSLPVGTILRGRVLISLHTLPADDIPELLKQEEWRWAEPFYDTPISTLQRIEGTDKWQIFRFQQKTEGADAGVKVIIDSLVVSN